MTKTGRYSIKNARNKQSIKAIKPSFTAGTENLQKDNACLDDFHLIFYRPKRAIS